MTVYASFLAVGATAGTVLSRGDFRRQFSLKINKKNQEWAYSCMKKFILLVKTNMSMYNTYVQFLSSVERPAGQKKHAIILERRE